MFKNFLKIGFRNLKKHKGYSFINITGLAIGLAVFMILSFYVIDDLTYDHYHKNSDRIYRIITLDHSEGKGILEYGITSGPLILAAKEKIPEVSGSTRVSSFGSTPIRKGEAETEHHHDSDGIRARSLITDAGFFDVFDFKILKGETENPLVAPDGIFLTPKIAIALFGDENPIGQPVNCFGQNGFVAGIVEEPPLNSHIRFEVLVPLRVEMNPVWWDSWENVHLTGYLILNEQADPKEVKKKLTEIGEANGFANIFSPALQPLLDVHLKSSHMRYDWMNRGKNDAMVVYSMLVIAVLILFTASINFINLSSARATHRAREVGLRKVVGSGKGRLIIQFLGESIFLTLIATIIALAVLQLAVPHLTTFLNKQLDINFIKQPLLALGIIGIAILVGILSGIYPAMILSRFKPVTVLKGDFRTSRQGIILRRILVISQFAISIALIVGVLIVVIQINYLKAIDMGYNRDHVLLIPNRFEGTNDLLKDQLQTIPSIRSLGRLTQLPGNILARYEVIPEGKEKTQSQMFDRLTVGDGFIETLNISIIQGRGLSKEYSSDATNAVMLNETAVKMAGWTNPIGKRINIIEENGKLDPRLVVGVVKDIHFRSTRQAVEPMMLMYNPGSRFLMAKIAGGKIVETVKQVEKIHKSLYPDRDFPNFFLDENFDQQFNQDRNFATKIAVFSGLAILIACLGLFGLASFTIEQRLPEIAVRKVLGCNEIKIVSMLANDFVKWVILANIIAWPLSYYGMKLWLSDFVYKAPFAIWPFPVAGAIVLLIALLTVSIQSIRAARINPAVALRQET